MMFFGFLRPFDLLKNFVQKPVFRGDIFNFFGKSSIKFSCLKFFNKRTQVEPQSESVPTFFLSVFISEALTLDSILRKPSIVCFPVALANSSQVHKVFLINFHMLMFITKIYQDLQPLPQQLLV